MSEQRRVRLFRNGRHQTVRIPVEFELPGDEANMHRDGERLVIELVRKRGLVALLKTMNVHAQGETLNVNREQAIDLVNAFSKGVSYLDMAA